MPIPQVTGLRALHAYRTTKAEAAGAYQPPFMAELAGDMTGEALAGVCRSLEAEAAVRQNSAWRLEHTDAYCLARDLRYAYRSRRWLLGRNLSTKVDNSIALWSLAIRKHQMQHPNLEKQTSVAPAQLEQLQFEQVLVEKV